MYQTRGFRVSFWMWSMMTRREHLWATFLSFACNSFVEKITEPGYIYRSRAAANQAHNDVPRLDVVLPNTGVVGCGGVQG